MTLAFAESALAAIEFPSALESVAEHAVTALGAAWVRALRPSADAFWVNEELALVSAVAGRLADREELRPEPFPDVAAFFARLRLEGSVLDGGELVAVGVLLAAARLSFGRVDRAARAAPRLQSLSAPPLPRELEDRLSAALEPDGQVKDSASPALARARREVRSAREKLVARLGAILGGLDPHHRSPDAEVTVRGGRYVIPVRRDARSRLAGIVHDESATHATLFVEPTEAIELGNHLREVVAEEAREVHRVLRALTAALREHADGLQTAFERLVVLDGTCARASYALARRAVRPAVGECAAIRLCIHGGAHPLLFASSAPVVTFDLELGPEERTLLVSGPNTGGKTVIVKAVGLIAALAQSGVIPPVGEGTALPVFSALFADIGDRQSIQESLSTFSAHVAALRDILERADAGSLVLLDEVGSGTDPAEGGALAAAVLRSLTARGALTVASTHLGTLKRLAEAERGIVNASLQFDGVTLTPTYRFTKGVPGRSYALAIARNLGLDAAVLADAEAALPDADRTLDQALAAIERRDRELAERVAAADTRAATLEGEAAVVAGAQRRLAEREQLVRAREKEIERVAKHAARDALKEARAELERAIATVKEEKYREARRALEDAMARAAADEAAAVADEGAPEGAAGEASGASGGRTARSARTAPAVGGGGLSRRAGAAGVRPPGSHLGAPRAALVSGVRVRVPSLGLEGELESAGEVRAFILVRGRRVRVATADLVLAGPGDEDVEREPPAALGEAGA
jgi:DNA mismatch repair protein MutS2